MPKGRASRVRPVLLLGLAGSLTLLLWQINRERAASSLRVVGGLAVSVKNALVKLLEGEEGRVPYVYRDSRGIETFGIGHKLVPGDDYLRKYTKANPAPDALVESILAKDTAIAAAAVNKLAVPLTDNRRAALVSLAFNIGAGAFAGSTVARQVKAGNHLAAADAFLLWKKAGSDPNALLKRRQRERAIYLSA